MSITIPDLVRVRARHPEAVAEAAARRGRRPLVGDSGRLMIVAADHPARGALGVGDRRLAMANRADLLERLCVALSRPGVDGVLATADILDDLLLLSRMRPNSSSRLTPSIGRSPSMGQYRHERGYGTLQCAFTIPSIH